MLDTFRQFSIGTQLIIAGEGTYKEFVQKRATANKNITYLGFVSMEQLINCFGVVDALVVPSLCYENSPTVIFESLYFGVPVLASRIEGIAELIVEGENGLTFESGNLELLKQKMRWCLENRNELKEMSKKTTRSLVGLSTEIYIKKLIVLYHS